MYSHVTDNSYRRDQGKRQAEDRKWNYFQVGYNGDVGICVLDGCKSDAMRREGC